MAWAESSVPDDPGPVPSWWPDAAAAVDGVLSGPVSRWQSMAHPVAAGPAKVGLNVPRLDVVTVSGLSARGAARRRSRRRTHRGAEHQRRDREQRHKRHSPAGDFHSHSPSLIVCSSLTSPTTCAPHARSEQPRRDGLHWPTRASAVDAHQGRPVRVLPREHGTTHGAAAKLAAKYRPGKDLSPPDAWLGRCPSKSKVGAPSSGGRRRLSVAPTAKFRHARTITHPVDSRLGGSQTQPVSIPGGSPQNVRSRAPLENRSLASSPTRSDR